MNDEVFRSGPSSFVLHLLNTVAGFAHKTFARKLADPSLHDTHECEHMVSNIYALSNIYSVNLGDVGLGCPNVHREHHGNSRTSRTSYSNPSYRGDDHYPNCHYPSYRGDDHYPNCHYPSCRGHDHAPVLRRHSLT